ncbi:hypothetical protein KKE60_07865, partial [Patescibacteria group bacterium]|nr:hypothetical protein [Patescibacteria group bacterium]
MITNEGLVRRARDFDELPYPPMLAERWEVSADGLTWDFYLRQGVQFQEGWGEFIAEDAVYSCQLIASPGSTSGYASWFRIGGEGNMESYEIVSPYHFRMHLIKPYTKMIFTISGGEGGMIVSKKYYEAVGYDYAIQHPIGTGPWRLIDHKPAEYMKYEAVENHWRQTPEFKYLVVKGVPELSTRLAMLKTGAADLAEVPIEFAGDLEAAGLKIKAQAGGGAGNLLLGGVCLPTREAYDPTCPWVPHQDEADAVA